MKKILGPITAIAVTFVLIFLNTDTNNKSLTANESYVIETKAKVLTVDSSDVIAAGISNIGSQHLDIEVLKGEYKGQILECHNTLMGQIDTDQIYFTGDTVLLALQIKDNEIINAVPVELYRQTWLLVLFLFFVIVLLIYARAIGINALLSFVLSILVLWKFFIKGLLNGGDPLLLTTLTVILLSAIIIFLVAGFTKKGFSAFFSTIIGLFITLLLTHFFGNKIALYGLTQSYVLTLVNSGYFNLDVREIFYAAVVLGASGAAMDIAMDIAASMHEIKEKKPEIEFVELMKSGINVGRHVIGTMSTTLLLAYSGSYLTLLMVFQVKNTSFIRMINLKLVAAEVTRTLIGSTGLVIVAPLTALITAYIMTREKRTATNIREDNKVSVLSNVNDIN